MDLLLQKDPRHFTLADIAKLQENAIILNQQVQRLDRFLDYARTVAGYRLDFPKYHWGLLRDIDRAVKIAEQDIALIRLERETGVSVQKMKRKSK